MAKITTYTRTDKNTLFKFVLPFYIFVSSPLATIVDVEALRFLYLSLSPLGSFFSCVELHRIVRGIVYY